VPLGPGIVKSEILQPTEGEVLRAGTNRIAGIAWAGEERISRVDVSTDGGRTWQAAHLKGMLQPYSWCGWECLWTVSAPGDYTVLARAHSESGKSQPFEYDAGNLGYLINIVLPRSVRIAAGEPVQGAFADADVWADTMLTHAEENTRRSLDLEMAFTAGDGI
jgi:hypothetical protein